MGPDPSSGLVVVVGMTTVVGTEATRQGENARARQGAMMCVPTATRKATGPWNATRRSTMRWPGPTWPKVKKKSRAFFWPTTSSSTCHLLSSSTPLLWHPLPRRQHLTASSTSRNSRSLPILVQRRRTTTVARSSTSVPPTTLPGRGTSSSSSTPRFAAPLSLAMAPSPRLRAKPPSSSPTKMVDTAHSLEYTSFCG
jgi:hypothetical protein